MKNKEKLLALEELRNKYENEMDLLLKYLHEIEDLTDRYKLTAVEGFTLRMAASFKVSNLDYDKLKEEIKKGNGIKSRTI